MLPGITLDSEQILFTDLGPCWEHDRIRLKCSFFDSTIHLGGVTIRKRTVLLLHTSHMKLVEIRHQQFQYLVLRYGPWYIDIGSEFLTF